MFFFICFPFRVSVGVICNEFRLLFKVGDPPEPPLLNPAVENIFFEFFFLGRKKNDPYYVGPMISWRLMPCHFTMFKIKII